MNKKILYIHGLSSSGSSSTPKTIAELLPNIKMISPDLPIRPFEARDMLRNLCREENPDIVIGTSMGGLFAQLMHEYVKILVNPSFHVSENMGKNIGIQPFFNTRVDGATHYENTFELCMEYRELEKNQFADICSFDRDNTYALFGSGDSVVNCRQEYLSYYQNAIDFNGGHRLCYEDIRMTLIPLIEKLMYD